MAYKAGDIVIIPTVTGEALAEIDLTGLPGQLYITIISGWWEGCTGMIKDTKVRPAQQQQLMVPE